MAMKKTSGGDSPLWQGVRKSFRTIPIFGSTAAVDRDVFWKTDRPLRFFSSGGIYRRRAMSEEGPGGHTRGWRGPGAGRATCACGPLVPRLLLFFGSLEASL
jgi:hypothetical protein